MLKSIIIAIVVAVVVWALTFDLFFAYKGTVLSFTLAMAAAIIVGLLLRAITPNIGILIIVAAIVAIGASFVASKFVPKASCVSASEVKISCPPEANPDCLEINKGTNFQWDPTGLAAGVKFKVHKFHKKVLFFKVTDHPVDKDEYSGNNSAKVPAKVDNKSGYFKYSVTCSAPGQPDKTKDPMIKVP